MTSATDQRPHACRRRGCAIRYWHDVDRMRTVLQHGDNPEAVLFIDDAELTTFQRPKGMSIESAWRCHMTDKLILWTNAIHRYEDGAQTAPVWPEAPPLEARCAMRGDAEE